MSRNYQRGIVTAYDNSLSLNQSGAGFMDFIRGAINTGKRVNNFAKKNNIISKIGRVANNLGATDYLDSKTGGNFSKGINMGIQKGYGRRRKQRGGNKGGCKRK